MLFQVTYEAFHRAGYDRKKLMGSDAGVYVGLARINVIQEFVKFSSNSTVQGTIVMI